MADSVLATAEVESLRFHLGYGNVSVGGYPYTPDGFFELFRDVIAPNLTTGAETSATTSIAAGAAATVAPAAMTSIAPYTRLVIDVGDAAEVVVVKATSPTTFSASFAQAHPSTGYPVAVFSGVSRLRLMLHNADRAWAAIQGPDVGANAGIKKVDEIEFFQGSAAGAVLEGLRAQYGSIVAQISSLVRVPIVQQGVGSSCAVEAY